MLSINIVQFIKIINQLLFLKNILIQIDNYAISYFIKYTLLMSTCQLASAK